MEIYLERGRKVHYILYPKTYLKDGTPFLGMMAERANNLSYKAIRLGIDTYSIGKPLTPPPA